MLKFPRKEEGGKGKGRRNGNRREENEGREGEDGKERRRERKRDEMGKQIEKEEENL